MVKYIYIFILNSILLNAQNSIVKYNAIEINKNEYERNLPIDQRKSFSDASNLISKLEIELVFNDSISVFRIANNFRGSSLEEKLAITKAGLSTSRYIDLNQKKSFYNNTGNPITVDKEFLVFENLNFDWQIINETKMIGNFKVIKAIGKANKNDRLVDIIAWFSPELPYKHGPYGIGNLPGLILEMQIGNIMYGAKEILINKSTNKIDFPKEGKLIYVKDFYALRKRRFEEFGAIMK